MLHTLNTKQEAFYALAALVAYGYANLFAALSLFTLDVNKLVFLAVLAVGALAAICLCFIVARQAASEDCWPVGLVSSSVVFVGLLVQHVGCSIRNKVEQRRVDRINTKHVQDCEAFDRIARNAAKQFDNR